MYRCTNLKPLSLILSDTFDVSALRFRFVTSLFIVFLLLHPRAPGPGLLITLPIMA